MKETMKRVRGSDNVFLDLGFPREEAENLKLRAEVMSQLRDVARGMTQVEAGRLFGVTQPRVNDLIKGRIEKFSLDALVNMAAKAGMQVKLTVRKAA